MSYLILLVVFMFISPLIRYVSYISPILGMLCYVVLILAFVSYSRRRARSFQRNFYGNAGNTNAQYQQTQQTQSQETKQERKPNSDVIDVEFSEEEVD